MHGPAHAIRGTVYLRRADMVLRMLEQRTGISYRPVRLRVSWGPLMPQDRGRLVREEQVLVETGLHSRRRAMTELGVDDPEMEMARVREEQAGAVMSPEAPEPGSNGAA